MAWAWHDRREQGVSQKKTRQHQNKRISPDDKLSLPSGCRLSGRLALSLRLEPRPLTGVKLGIRVNYANSNHCADICDGMPNSIKWRFQKKKKNQTCFPSSKLLPLPLPLLHFSFLPLSFSAWPITLSPSPPIGAPLSPLPSLHLSLALYLSLRHGQGRISRQSQAVQTQLYDRKNSQPWERNFPSELTH